VVIPPLDAMPSLHHQPPAPLSEPIIASTKSSKFKGVHWDKTKTKWVGYIHMKGKKHHLGYFGTEEEAARAYDRESIRCRGVAKNFPRTDYPAQDLAQEPEVRKALEKSSRYTGVSWNKLRRKWAARIIIEGKSQHLGHYALEADAARAYDRVCLQSRGTTKNFPVEEYLEYFVSNGQKLLAQPGAQQAQHLLPQGNGLVDLAAMQQQQLQTLMVHGQHPSSSGVEENSQDSTTCAESLKQQMEGQPRLFLQGRASQSGQMHHIMPDGKTLAAAQNPLGANPPFNLYTTLSSNGMVQASMPFQPMATMPMMTYQHLGNPVASYQQVFQHNWGQQPAVSAPSQLVSYSTSLPGLSGLLPIGGVKNEQVQHVAQNGLPAGNMPNPLLLTQQQLQQTATQGQPVHAGSPYTFVTSQAPQAMIPASAFLTASTLQLPGMPSSAAPLQPGAPQMTTQGMAQLQALVLQNCNTAMFSPQHPALVSNPLYSSSDKVMMIDQAQINLQKRQRLDGAGAAT